MIPRRTLLGLAGVGVATAATTAWAQGAARGALPLAYAGSGGHAAHGGHAPTDMTMPTVRPADAGTRPALEKFTIPLPRLRTVEPVVRSSEGDVYASSVRRVSTEVFPGHAAPVFGYFGSWEPRVVRVRQGKRAVVAHKNDTDMPISVHLHGGVTRAQFDGQMSTPVAPGETFGYLYDNDQPAAALWMHDHTHMMDAQHVYEGMATPYIIGSDAEDALGLPSGEFEVPLVLRDGDFGSAGQLVFTMDDTESRSTILVNGRPWPYLEVAARKYRFRIINASNMRFFVLGLSTATPFLQVGGDCGLLPAPFEAPVVVLSPGERSDVVVDFSAFAPGTVVDLGNYIGPGNMDDVGQVMRFVVGDPVADDSRVPDVLTTLPALPAATTTREFTLLSSEPGESPMTGTINGQVFAMDRVDHEIAWGTTEEWVVTNANLTVPHNFHSHLAHLRVVSRSGGPVTPDESGVKDTVQVFPGQSVRLRLTFDSHRGVYPIHCHMLDHGAMGMMTQFRVV